MAKMADVIVEAYGDCVSPSLAWRVLPTCGRTREGTPERVFNVVSAAHALRNGGIGQ